MTNTRIENDSDAAHLDIHRNAYNAAFYELGLKWHWDGNTYQNLLLTPDENDRIRLYLITHQPHLLKAYDAEFLINAIQTAKARCYDAMAACGSRLGAAVNWAEFQKCEIGV